MFFYFIFYVEIFSKESTIKRSYLTACRIVVKRGNEFCRSVVTNIIWPSPFHFVSSFWNKYSNVRFLFRFLSFSQIVKKKKTTTTTSKYLFKLTPSEVATCHGALQSTKSSESQSTNATQRSSPTSVPMSQRPRSARR